MRRAYLIHGWDGNPENCWFPWLKENLERNGFEVRALALPNPPVPDPRTWPQTLLDQISNPDEQTFLVGHSIGCQTIMRYLAALPDGVQVGGTLFVAPFFKLIHLQTAEEKEIWQRWEDLPFDLEKTKTRAKDIVSIFSDDDPDVDYGANAPEIKEKLGSKIILEHGKGHFSDHDQVLALPSALSELLAMAAEQP